VTAARPSREADIPVLDACCPPGRTCGAEPGMTAASDAGWRRTARLARWLAWASLAWMCAEGAIGLWQGLADGSIALTGWALGSAVEGLASVIVIWRFTGTRTLSGTAERRAQRAIAVSFWLLAPCIGAGSVHNLAAGHHAGATAAGIALTAAALLMMPLLGRTKHKLAARPGLAATAGEGTQNYLCAAQAAAVLAVLAITAAWPGIWWIDPVTGLGIAAASVREGARSWHGGDCC
jgi:divalent metal cation (Fe/Co/Zn/Cd) transporter